MWHPVFIALGPSGRLVEHTAKDNTTSCGITWDSLPDIIASDGEVWVGDKAWYADHDVQDYEVPACDICPVERLCANCGRPYDDEEGCE
jgi:hypothetical protein